MVEKKKEPEVQVYNPNSPEAMEYMESLTVISCHREDGTVVNVPMAELDNYLAKRREERKAERRRVRRGEKA